MANIADCWVSFHPMSAEFAADLERRIAEAAGVTPADIGRTESDGGVRFDFTGRWTCDAGWEMLEELLSDTAYTFREELLACEVNGRGTELGCQYHEGVKKFPGRSRLQRKPR